jgi:hypothetical protein
LARNLLQKYFSKKLLDFEIDSSYHAGMENIITIALAAGFVLGLVKKN